jgi:ribosomal protein S3
MDTARTLDAGLTGIKVWIYKGTKTDYQEEE